MKTKSFFVALFITNSSFAMGAETPSIRNVIVMIPDGTSVSHISFARLMNNGNALAMDPHAKGLVRTFSANDPITDSAAAATAIAVGIKTNNGFIGLSPSQTSVNTKANATLSVMEKAKASGKSIGLVVTSPIQHATPAAFTAHTTNRDDYDSIALQQVKLGIDFVSGGGLRFLRPEKRSDKKDLIAELKNSNIALAQTRDQTITNEKATKLWAIWAQEDLPYEIDRDSSQIPSLAEMTQIALDRLSKNKLGFFLLVEGSKVDYASHANDPASVAQEFLAFNDAATKAFAFAQSRSDTVVLVSPDHGNGGMSIGDDGHSNSPTPISLEQFLTPIRAVKASNLEALRAVKPNLSNLRDVLGEKYALHNLTAQEEQRVRESISAAKGDPTALSVRMTIGRILSARAHIGWTTGGHTGEDVPFFCFHPAKKCPTGVIDNTQIACFLEAMLH